MLDKIQRQLPTIHEINVILCFADKAVTDKVASFKLRPYYMLQKCE